MTDNREPPEPEPVAEYRDDGDERAERLCVPEWFKREDGNGGVRPSSD
jgi:hypothetical protein